MLSKKKTVTLKTLSKELGLSQGTISRALRGDRAIKDTTRKKIKHAAKNLGYQQKIKDIETKEAIRAIENAGKLPDTRSTIYDIARSVNLSVATVSRALNDSPKVKKDTKLKIQSIAISSNYNLSNEAKTLVSGKPVKGNKITIYDIAQKLNLSASTVSRCLNDKEGVSGETAKLVKKAADDIGYMPDLNATELRAQKTITIGVLIPKFNKQMDMVLQGIEKIAANRKINLVVNNCFAFEPLKIRHINNIVKSADGIIALPGPYDNLKVLTNQLFLKNTPTVWLGSYQYTGRFDTVTINPFNTIYEVTSYLIESGNSTICYVDPIEDTPDAPRMRAFRQALYDHNLPFEKHLVIQGSNSINSSEALVDTILSNNFLPDAIMMINCSLGPASLAMLQNAGIDIDNRLVTCEFDLGLLADRFQETKSRVSYDLHDLGEKGITRLMAKIDGLLSAENELLFSKHLFIPNTTFF